MGLRINNNITAYTAHRNLAATDSLMTKSIQRLSSGLRINQAKDDVAGLAIANQFRAGVRGLRMAQQNTAQGTAMLQMAEGAAGQIEGILERLKELAVSAASSNTDANGRASLDAEASALISEIDRIANGTTYNTQALINGDLTANFTFQVGDKNDANHRITVDLTAVDFRSVTLGVDDATIDLSTDAASAQAALTAVETAISAAGTNLGTIGAAQSRIEFAAANLATSVENLAASESTIRDADMAYEMISFTRNQIMMQAGTAMLAQANMAPQSVLSLFG